ncbi:CHAT domain-containing protein [Ramlibacter sp. WS9]|uniref:CHAT domain-containing protein n=1 Tax=Ramlibacter sp. WS9 TaxID=1882741 RepID=UPI00114279D5|nr:CHAT domain-containing protein [Ramlibacter sp. WS9]ROZ63407.1 CHAT domain-containing protein [Ramlibacter sp. WS9]
MKLYSELEIVIQRDAQDNFQVGARHRVDEGDSITPNVPITLSAAAPEHFSPDPRECGKALSQAIFGPPAIRDALVAAQARSENAGLQLRVRLRIDPGASALHSLRWETLTDPRDDSFLLLSGQSIFSRYLFSRELRLPKLRAKQGLQALIVVANPSGLNADFAQIDVPTEVSVAQQALSPLVPTVLASGGQATAEGLLAGLAEGVDILYLVCHGAMTSKGPKLWLEGADGGRDLVDGQELAARIGALEKGPTLVVLCSCQSSGTGMPTKDALTALGPLLAKEGVPAVLAMQGNLTMQTASRFMPKFFAELANHGEVDRAAAAARAAVLDRPDWWMPVVFTRLDSARIWYRPGFGKSDDGIDPWASIVGNLNARECTPVLGPSMAEALFGSRRELAALWGEMYRYPMSGNQIEDLPQVAQYLAVMRQGAFPRREFYLHVYRGLLERHADLVPEEFKSLKEHEVLSRLGEMVSQVGARLRAADASEPHAVLASFKLPVYVTTDPSDLLVDALREQGARPRVRLLRWNKFAEKKDDEYVEEAKSISMAGPTEKFPIVVKLFGDLAEPRSLVMTEDQYFDYLTKATASAESIPSAVRHRLTDSGLLFVGFQAEAWEFRVLFRSLLNLPGQDLRKDYEHFSVQIDPNSILDPGSARRYIEEYLQEKAKLKLYWGDVPTFVKELQRRTSEGA